MSRLVTALLILVLLAGAMPAEAAEYGSVFRGVIVQTATPGPKVVSVDPTSAAYASGLRAGDQILRIEDMPVATLEDFATASQHLKGKAAESTVIVMRNSESVTLQLSLHSRPIEEAWGERFVPDARPIFSDPLEGAKYWAMQARKYRLATDEERYLNALWNLLHYEPDSVGTAMLIGAASTRRARRELRAGQRVEGMRALRTAVKIYHKAFARDLTDDELARVNDGLFDVQATLLQLAQSPPSP